MNTQQELDAFRLGFFNKLAAEGVTGPMADVATVVGATLAQKQGFAVGPTARPPSLPKPPMLAAPKPLANPVKPLANPVPKPPKPPLAPTVIGDQQKQAFALGFRRRMTEKKAMPALLLKGLPWALRGIGGLLGRAGVGTRRFGTGFLRRGLDASKAGSKVTGNLQGAAAHTLLGAGHVGRAAGNALRSSADRLTAAGAAGGMKGLGGQAMTAGGAGLRAATSRPVLYGGTGATIGSMLANRGQPEQPTEEQFDPQQFNPHWQY